MRRTRLLSIAPLALACVVAAGAQAQERTYTISGSGSLALPGDQTRSAQRAELTLTDAGAFVATIFAGSDRYQVHGKWSRRGGPGATEHIQVTDAFGDPRATGTGRIIYRDNRSPQSLSLSGTMRGGDYRFDITGAAAVNTAAGEYVGPRAARARAESHVDTRVEVNAHASATGHGMIHTARGDWNESGVAIDFRPNGVAHLAWTGDTPVEMTGRWTRTLENTYRIQLDRVNDEAATGALTVVTRGGGDAPWTGARTQWGGGAISSIVGEGHALGDRFSLDFAVR